ncbi:MAG: hypothetical protein IK095_09025 [Oscillospiraceae bacterium]|nr:hypothetical protein [Oscillospiraceae bacterium]
MEDDLLLLGQIVFLFFSVDTQMTLYHCFDRLCDAHNVTELPIQSHRYVMSAPETHTVESSLH